MTRIARFPALAVLVSASALISACSAENTGRLAPARLDSRAPSAVRRAAPGAAATVPALALDQVASGLGSITGITTAGDDRLFLTLQAGQIVIWDGSQVLA